MSLSAESLPQIRFDITEASRILRELQRYVTAKG
jgi:hypothetical protein